MSCDGNCKHCSTREFPKCPNCDNELHYVMRSYEIWQCESLPDEDGFIDLLAMIDTHPDESFTPFLECPRCAKQFTLQMKPMYSVMDKSDE